MKIDKSKLKIGMWYTDIDGNVIEKVTDSVEIPKGAVAYHTQYPLEITERIRGIYTNKDTCKHPRKYIKRTYGWIKGIKGRQCKNCGKTQLRKWWQPWGFKWDNGADSYDLCEGHTHIGRGNEDVILAMANSGDYTLSEAIIVWASACERCMNVLTYKYLNGADGYEEFSEEWKKANTVCDFCKDIKNDVT